VRAGAFLAAFALFFAIPARAQDNRPGEPRRVFVLDSYGREFSPYAELSSFVRAELVRRYGHPIDFFHVTLQTHGFEARDEDAVADYVGAICGRRAPDLVLTNGGPAARFFAKYRERFGAGVPVVHGGPDVRWLAGLRLSPQETAVVVRLDLQALIRNILLVRPRTKEVVVIFGDSVAERFWAENFRREWRPWAARVRLTYLDGLSFEEVLKRCERLPPDVAIFFGLMITDSAGVPHEQQSALERLHRVASAPIFSWATISLGHGIVGGPLHPVERMAGDIAAAGVKVLQGAAPASIPVKTVVLSSPVYDARELERWGIDEKSLPPGSEIRFRQHSFFALYRGRILAVAAVLLLQAVAIVALVEGRRRQRRAEREAARLRNELAHAGRVSVMGQLASSLAHELAQPLGAMLRNAEAAELYLAAEKPDLAELRAIVADLKADDERAREVIERMRRFLRRHELNRVPVEPVALVEGVLALVRPDAGRRGVAIELNAGRDLPKVTGDPVHLQQVLLNLIVNALDAMDAVPAGERALRVRLRRAEEDALEIAVLDTGPGIPPEARDRLFEPFFTTKEQGLGMGLPICRSLVEAHGGTLRDGSPDGRGAAFVVTLPGREEGR
jgi:signal transduction histidine kinase